MPVFRWHDHSRFREFMDKVTSNLNTKQRILIILQYSKLKVLISHSAFSAGNPNAKVVFIGEAPGKDENAQGLPFVGRAGQLLNTHLEKVGINRERDLYIANILKCRPTNPDRPNKDRVPATSEIKNCIAYL